MEKKIQKVIKILLTKFSPPHKYREKKKDTLRTTYLEYIWQFSKPCTFGQ